MHEADKEKAAFATPDGLCEFNVPLFGLCNAAAKFERMTDNLFSRAQVENLLMLPR